jgi:hypothetical protein
MVCAGMHHYWVDALIVNRHIPFINNALTRLPRTWERSQVFLFSSPNGRKDDGKRN